ncbi:hypothetical protein GCM10025883_16910 [Mobilicoccus caccae]|uniref:Core-binding (CB) domain-containing protein n=1 Tax=Mobilicoccus caccae TaxID=1859295 RepID=A0ABQ6IRD4_9MICO|nr:hypothetical protein GCM10025883_16910 [Mobilicoccus caccae]
MTRALPAQWASWLAHLRIERGLAANTLRSYERDLRRYDAYLERAGRAQAGEVTRADVTSFVAAVREGGDGGRRCRPPRPPASSRRCAGSTASRSWRG